MDVEQLERTAKELVPPGKGLLAADESFGTIGKRFEASVSKLARRRAAVSGVVFTRGKSASISPACPLRRDHPPNTSDGKPLVEVLEEQALSRDQGGQEHRGSAPCPR